MKSNIIIFATFWNERDWIETSLEQIDKIDPLEVIICDGCFDNNVKEINSTDGTREIIEEWVSKRSNARMISPLRVNRIKGLYKLYLGHNKLPSIHYLYPTRIFNSILKSRKSMYRVNQALTFNHMISLSKFWRVSGWFMNYDCDQFYTDESIEKIREETRKDDGIGLMTAKEMTFFNGFDKYTEEYEKRDYNNMPHRIYKDTCIVVTRLIVREKVFSYKKYKECENSLDLGKYFHYKFKFDNERYDKGYTLGDRKKPNISSYNNRDMKGSNIEHPQVVQKLIMSLKTKK